MVEHRADLSRRLRQAYLSGIEELFWRRRGRGLTDKETRQALRDYPDVWAESTD